MRDTPRTDEREAKSEGLHDEWCFSFCRSLEREVNALRSALTKARPFVKSWGELNDENWHEYREAINAVDEALKQ
jgi:hypothetical protein